MIHENYHYFTCQYKIKMPYRTELNSKFMRGQRGQQRSTVIIHVQASKEEFKKLIL